MMIGTSSPSKLVELLRPVELEYTAAPILACRYCDDSILVRVEDRFVSTTRAYVRQFRCDRCGAGAVQL